MTIISVFSLWTVLLTSGGARAVPLQGCEPQFPPAWAPKEVGDWVELPLDGRTVLLHTEAGAATTAPGSDDVTAEKARLLEELPPGVTAITGDVQARIMPTTAGEPMVALEYAYQGETGAGEGLRLVRRCGTRLVGDALRATGDAEGRTTDFSLVSQALARLHYTHPDCTRHNEPFLDVLLDDDEPARRLRSAVEGAAAAPAAVQPGAPAASDAAPVAAPVLDQTANADNGAPWVVRRWRLASLLAVSLALGLWLAMRLLRKEPEYVLRPYKPAPGAPALPGTQQPAPAAGRYGMRQGLEGPPTTSGEWSAPPRPTLSWLDPPTTGGAGASGGARVGSYSQARGAAEDPERIGRALAALGQAVGADYVSPGLTDAGMLPPNLAALLHARNGGRYGKGWLMLLGLERPNLDIRALNRDQAVKARFGTGWCVGFTCLGDALFLAPDGAVELRRLDGGREQQAGGMAVFMEALVADPGLRDKVADTARIAALRQQVGEVPPGHVYWSLPGTEQPDGPVEVLPFLEALGRNVS